MKLSKAILFPLMTAGFLFLTGADVHAGARIASVQGQVESAPAGGTDWKPASEGQVLDDGAQVRTGPGATCQVLLQSGQRSAVSLKENTRVTIERSSPADIRLHEGRIFSLIKELKGEQFLVRTPTSVAAARGTGGDHGVDSLAVHDGVFEVTTDSGEEREIGEGQGVFFEEGGFGETFEVDAAAREEWERFEQSADQELSKTAEGAGDTAKDTQSESPEAAAPEEEGAPEEADAFVSPEPAALGDVEGLTQDRVLGEKDENTQDINTEEDVEKLDDEKPEEEDKGTGNVITTTSI